MQLPTLFAMFGGVHRIMQTTLRNFESGWEKDQNIEFFKEFQTSGLISRSCNKKLPKTNLLYQLWLGIKRAHLGRKAKAKLHGNLCEKFVL